ncbi:hypothetical protein FACS189434_05450 [Bacteroidia bacterium]|nr:hypothetical protein FACS189434_05450 [Bacteroidia bacterium]
MKRISIIILLNVLLASVAFADVFTAGEKVYFSTENNSWWASDGAKLTAYFFNEPGDDAWAGVEATLEEGTLYSIAAPGTNGKTWANIIFVRKADNAASLTDWADVWNQTADIAAQAGDVCFYIGETKEGNNFIGIWGEKPNGGGTPPPPPAEVINATENDLQKNIVIGVTKPAEWAEIYVYFWATGTNGYIKPIEYEGVYACGFDYGEVNVIFLSQSSFPNETPANEDEAKAKLGKQTINIEGITESGCYEIVDATYEEGDSDWGKRRINTASECPFVTLTPPPPPPAAVGSTKDSGINVWVEGNSLKISTETAAQVEIFSVTGQKVFAGTADKTCSVELKQGIYLLKINNLIYKTVIN